MAGLDAGLLNLICGAFLALRAVYAVVYVVVADQKLSGIRSLIWMGSVGCCLYLMVKAGNVLVNSSGLSSTGL